MDDRYKGKVRDKDVKVGNILFTVYRGADKEITGKETKLLFTDIADLRAKKLTMDECFHYASFIHRVFVKIYPFTDGNGRAARLLEKWFLSKLHW